MNPYKKPYLDSCVYIAEIKGPLSDEAEKAELANRILTAAEQGEFSVVASTAVIAEVVKLRRGGGQTPPEDLVKINGVLDRSCFLWVEVDKPVALKAQELQRKYATLKPLDAIHIACALRGEADRVLTWDSVMLNAGVVEIPVAEPSYEGQEQMDIEGGDGSPRATCSSARAATLTLYPRARKGSTEAEPLAFPRLSALPTAAAPSSSACLPAARR